MTDPVALAAEARRLAESAGRVVIDHDKDCPHRYCADTPCEDPNAEGCEAGLGVAFVPCTCDGDRQALLAIVPALADAVEALAGERDRLTLAYRDETQGLAAVASGLHAKLEAARDEANAQRQACDGWQAAFGELRAERDRLAAELAEARAALLGYVPKCHECSGPATRAENNGFGAEHSCDEHAEPAGVEHYRAHAGPVREAPHADAIRAAVRARGGA